MNFHSMHFFDKWIFNILSLALLLSREILFLFWDASPRRRLTRIVEQEQEFQSDEQTKQHKISLEQNKHFFRLFTSSIPRIPELDWDRVALLRRRRLSHLPTTIYTWKRSKLPAIAGGKQHFDSHEIKYKLHCYRNWNIETLPEKNNVAKMCSQFFSFSDVVLLMIAESLR